MGTQNAAIWQSLSLMISGKAYETKLRRIVVRTGSFQTFEYGFSENNCPGFGDILKDPELVMFHCPRFAMERKNVNQALGRIVSPEKSCKDAEVEGESAYDFLCNCTNTERSKERKKESRKNHE